MAAGDGLAEEVGLGVAVGVAAGVAGAAGVGLGVDIGVGVAFGLRLGVGTGVGSGADPLGVAGVAGAAPEMKVGGADAAVTGTACQRPNESPMGAISATPDSNRNACRIRLPLIDRII